MVTKSKKTGAKKGRVKVGKLKLNEKAKDLTTSEEKMVRGGQTQDNSFATKVAQGAGTIGGR